MNPGFTACANTTPAENVELPQPVDGRSSGKNKNLVDLVVVVVLSQEVSAFWASDAFFLALTAASTLKVGSWGVGGGALFYLAEVWDVLYLQLDMWEFTSGRISFFFFQFPSLLSP